MDIGNRILDDDDVIEDSYGQVRVLRIIARRLHMQDEKGRTGIIVIRVFLDLILMDSFETSFVQKDAYPDSIRTCVLDVFQEVVCLRIAEAKEGIVVDTIVPIDIHVRT